MPIGRDKNGNLILFNGPSDPFFTQYWEAPHGWHRDLQRNHVEMNPTILRVLASRDSIRHETLVLPLRLFSGNGWMVSHHIEKWAHNYYDLRSKISQPKFL